MRGLSAKVAIGTTVRYGMAVLAIRWFGSDFPYGTLAVNLAGAFLIGFVQVRLTILHETGKAMANVIATTAFCLALCWLGMAAARFVTGGSH